MTTRSMTRMFQPFVLLLMIATCAAQQEQLGGVGGAGGAAGYQANGTHLSITTTGLPDATANSAYSQTLAAINGVGTLTWTVLLGALPPGLVLNSGTGTISGTPTTPGNNTFTILVTDSTTPTAQTATMQLSLAVDCPGLAITSTSPLPPALKGSAYSYQFLSQGGLGTITWGSTGPFPTGLTLATTGLLSGTPTQSGTFTPTVSATDSCPVTPQTVSQPFTLVVNSPIVITTASPLPGGTESTPYSLQFAASGGTAPYTWSLTSGLLPTGLMLASGGLLSGTPTATVTTTFKVTVTDTIGNTNTGQFTMTVACTPLSITSSGTLPNGTQGVAYSDQLTSSGGTGAIAWTLFSGTLSTGLGISTGGLINGTPSVSGVFNPTFQAQDSCAPTPQTAQLAGTLTIGAGLVIATTSPLPNATVGTPYSTQFSAAGGVQPYAWQILSGVLPTGLLMNSAGLINGTPTQAISSNINVQVQDNVGTIVTAPFTLTSSCTPLILSSTSPLPVATQGTPYSFQFAATGGFPSLSWQLIGGTLPAGLTLAPNGTLSGTPTAFGTFSPVIQVLDSCTPAQQSQQGTFNLTVNANTGGLTITTTSPLPPALVQLPAQALVQWTTAGSGLTYNVYRATTSGGPFTKLNSSPVACCTYTDITVVVGSTYYYVVRSFDGTNESVNSAQVQANIVTYSTQIAVTGGTAPYTYAVTVGSLPTGLLLNSTTGIISGIPTVSNTYNFTIQVTDSLSATASKAFTLVVSCGTVTLTSTSPIPTGTVGQAYSYQFSASGGLLPYTWTRTGGSFPAGLTLTTGGLLSGTPSASGSFSPVVQAADSCSPPSTASNTFALTINPQPGTLTITTTSPLPGATQGVAYSTSMAASGGTPPYSWSVTSGSQPPGITMNSAGVISGTPTTIGTTTATIQVADSASHTASGSFSLTVSCTALSITSPATLPQGTQNQAYSFQMAAQGGTGALTWALNTGSFPSGVSISSAGLISGTPSASGSFTPNVKVTDSCSTPQSVNQTETLVINAVPQPLAIVTTSPLPSGTVSVPYNITLTATGGTPPYGSWTVTSGSLPTGLSLSSAGVISGTPSVAQTTTPTIQVSDSVPNTASVVFSITINAATGEDNRYCSPSGVWTGPASDGPAAAPKTCVRTALADMPATGSTTTPTAGSCSSIQTALSAATAGSIIQIPHSNAGAQAQYTACQLTISTACSATNWCILETDSPSNLPAEGTRITPGWIGIASLPGRPSYLQPGTAGTYLPKIMTSGSGNNPTLKFAATAAYWLVRGLEFTQPAGTNVTQFVQGANGFHNIVLMQDIIHCGNSSTGQSKDSCQDGVLMAGSQYIAVVDSYIFDMHCVSGGVCQQAHGIGLGGNSTIAEGPCKIVNNFIEASGEVIFAGGGGGAAGSTILQVSDCEIRRNHTWWPLFWKQNDPSYFGTLFELDNQIESKNAQRLFIEGNIFSNTVGYQGSQHGQAIVFDPKSQSNGITNSSSSNGSGTLTRVSGASFTNGGLSTLCNPGGSSPGHCQVNYNGLAYTMQTFISTNQITVSPSPPTTTSASTTECLPGLNPNAQVNDVIFRYNYIPGALNVGTIASVKSDCGDVDLGIQRISWHDTVSDNISSFWANSSGACCAWVNGIEALNGGTGPMIPDSIFFDHNTVIDFLTTGVSGGAGVGPSLGEGSAGNQLTHTTFTNNIVAGGYGNPAHSAQFYWQTWVPKSQMCYDHNFHMQSTLPAGQGAVNANFPLPASTDSGNCTFTPTGNTQLTNFSSMQFTNLNGGIGGNYQLLSTSPGHLAGSDGKDVGANIPLLNQNIAGVN